MTAGNTNTSTAGHPLLPPHSKEAQRAVLGSCLRDNAAIGEALEALGGRAGNVAEKFYGFADSTVFAAMLHLYAGGKAVDLVTLAEELKRRSQLADVGGAEYVADLWAGAVSGANARYHAEIVRRFWLVRSLLYLARESQGRLEHPGADPDAEQEHIERELFRIAEVDSQGGMVPAKQGIREAFAWIDERAGGRHAALATGLVDLDTMLSGGLHDGELVIAAARPGHGKTAFALGIARHAVEDQRATVLFVSLEMRRLELLLRLLGMKASVRVSELRRGIIVGDTMQRLIMAGDDLDPAPLWIDDAPVQTLARIASGARRLKQRENLRLLVVDYLQLVEPETRKEPRHEQVGQMSRRLKCLARELGIPVLVLCQLNREVESRSDHRPKPSDLRESGSLEQDADCVLLLHRPEMYPPEDTKALPGSGRSAGEGEAEIIIGKQRSGITDRAVVRFEKEFMRFGDCVPAPPDTPTLFSPPAAG